ncbi:MAG: cobalamin biosynthesis protein CbiG [Limimaricola sp.]|uniref:molybdopterin guanine dinucleotide synthesis n=1 Tax=Limimaricola sp. TaxID=2211665 RepID=UPI001D88CA75|nr:molybdopterin guanine dinucleotide synthesis [Limimaricola sp.]MBI1418674.1 cobalamin biosynthesis protein CbiG [Limimaricola sp.]
MPLFDLHVMVDWSAAGTPRQGPDSIWIAVLDADGLALNNPATRAGAEAALDDLLAQATAAGRRALIGFDFPFGYPRGLSQAIRPGGDWRDVWVLIGRNVAEGAANSNNRFHAAARLNALFPGQGPFWGNGLKAEIPGLPRKKPDGWGAHLPANRRLAEDQAKGAQEVWKLSGVGSVGGQALTGIATLARLKARHALAIWPFEAVAQGHVAAEIYPSLLPVRPAPGQVKDAAQVEAVARAYAAADAQGLLGRMLAAPLAPAQRTDEATILGLSHVDAMRAA